MNSKKISIMTSAATIALLAGTAFPASASLLSTKVGLGVNASTTISTKLDVNAKNRADNQITARVNSLNNLKTRIGEMVKISANEKTSLTATVQSAIDEMTALKTKIDGDSDNTVLKTDIQSITKSYRIYLLVMPQIRIMAAADRIMDITSMFTSVSTQLETKIGAAQAGGHDVTGLNTSLTDMNTKVSDANVQAQAAVSEVTNLKPDNGDKTVFTANQTALKDARTKIKVATSDLVSARKDAASIVKGLATFGISVSASSTATSTIMH